MIAQAKLTWNCAGKLICEFSRIPMNPLLFTINMAAGHGGHSGRYDALKEDALTYAFILYQMGIVK